MSQSGILSNAAASPQAAAGTTNASGAAYGSNDEFLALLAQVIAPAAAEPDLPVTTPVAAKALPVDDAQAADAAALAALSQLPFAVPLPLPATNVPAPTTAPATTDDGAAVQDLLQTLAPALEAQVAAVPAADAGAKWLAPDDPLPDATASTDDATTAAALNAPPPRLETSGDGRTTLVVHKIDVPVGHPRWAESVGHEVRLLVERGVPSATLKLSPEHLGPVEVRIDLSGDKANVWFGAAHADTRAALTDAIPRLREMFAGAGLTLGDTGVRQDMPNRAGTSGSASGHGFGSDGDGIVTEAPAVDRLVRVGLVDAYA